MTSRAVLLDTCAVIWLADGSLNPSAYDLVVEAGLTDGIFVSPASAWEIGLLARPRSGRAPTPSFGPDTKTWFRNFMAGEGIRLAPLTTDIAIEAVELEVHGDPADRFIIATARAMEIPVVTSDGRILAYARQGLVEAIAC